MSSSNPNSLPIPFGWFVVGFSSDLAVGEVKPISYFGKQQVIFRTESGEAKVLDAYCPHLGAHLGHGGKVSGESIACPFHGWQFNGGGQCTAVPYAKNMPPKVAGDKQAVYAYPTVERNQMIWAWYHPQQIAPTYDVVAIPEFEAADWNIAEKREWIINTSIQEAAENGSDQAHFVYVHGTVDVPATDTVFEGIQRVGKLVAKVPALLEDGSFDPSGATANIYLTTTNHGPGIGHQQFTGALESVMVGVSTPVTNNQMVLRFVFVEPKSMSAGQQMMAAFAKNELCTQVEADIPIWEHKVYLESPTLCDGDGPIHQFRKWFKQFYAEPTAAPTNLRAAG
jgi:phenylpropionate dioxygenase-like ring-hydroxylating dioxygenase large terminal subunit